MSQILLSDLTADVKNVYRLCVQFRVNKGALSLQQACALKADIIATAELINLSAQQLVALDGGSIENRRPCQTDKGWKAAELLTASLQIMSECFANHERLVEAIRSRVPASIVLHDNDLLTSLIDIDCTPLYNALLVLRGLHGHV